MLDILKIIISIAVIIIAIVTCPNEQEHKDKLAAEIDLIIKNKISDESNDIVTNMIATALVGETVGILSEAFVDEYLEVDDYFIFSLGHYRINGENKYCTIGCFGHVFSFNTDEIKKSLYKLVEKTENPKKSR